MRRGWGMMGAVIAGCSMPMTAQARANDGVAQAVRRFLAAETAYDPAALAAVIASDYVEVSPAGEVDAHDRFLGFYAPEKKVPWPPTTTSEPDIRLFGDTAVEILTITYAMPAAAGGPAVSRSVRGSFVLQRQAGAWKLLSAQYTGIRPAPVP